jgi:hypothetical protein
LPVKKETSFNSCDLIEWYNYFNALVSRKKDDNQFMCLEDRFLFALYNQSGIVSVKTMADIIYLTENATLSIIHRIQTGFPHYLVLHDESADGVFISPNVELQQEVRLFLADGGFTAINEQELREYYKAEMEQYTRLQKIKNAVEQYGWFKWIAGAFVSTGAILTLGLLIKKTKNSL